MEDEAYAVETDGLAKRFGLVVALDRLTLRVPEGITYGLLGPNGSGKTTLIRLLAGLLRADAGSARVLGHDVTLSAEKTRHVVGYMTQADALYGDLTVQENVAFFADIFGVSDSRRVREVLRIVDLADRADSLVHTLSGGMRRRLSLATALVHRPRLLLLDEPTVGVDPQLRAAFWRHFHELNREGVTIIVSSHVMDEAERCDRLGLLREGRLLAEGTAEELRRRAGQETLEEAFLIYAEANNVAG